MVIKYLSKNTQTDAYKLGIYHNARGFVRGFRCACFLLKSLFIIVLLQNTTLAKEHSSLSTSLSPPLFTSLSPSLATSPNTSQNTCFKDIQTHYTEYTETIRSSLTKDMNHFWDIASLKLQFKRLHLPESEIPQRVLSYILFSNEQQKDVMNITHYHVSCDQHLKQAILAVEYDPISHSQKTFRFIRIRWNATWKIRHISFTNDLKDWSLDYQDLKEL